ncbi:MAG TPA: hypothetical protein VJV23_01680 [Candidatus Polarisedimenticolia bacterium]|nr:hypothetical protein [Candidatus Polarisedimenticolia bacterium]
MGNFDFESGKRHLEEGDFVEAIRCLLASLDMDPANVDAYVELFRAYDHAWHESGDPMVLDQMRKVALAGLKRAPDRARRDLLRQALDRTDTLLAELQQDEPEEGGQHAPRGGAGLRRLPIIRDDGGGPRQGGS